MIQDQSGDLVPQHTPQSGSGQPNTVDSGHPKTVDSTRMAVLTCFQHFSTKQMRFNPLDLFYDISQNDLTGFFDVFKPPMPCHALW